MGGLQAFSNLPLFFFSAFLLTNYCHIAPPLVPQVRVSAQQPQIQFNSIGKFVWAMSIFSLELISLLRLKQQAVACNKAPKWSSLLVITVGSDCTLTAYAGALTQLYCNCSLQFAMMGQTLVRMPQRLCCLFLLMLLLLFHCCLKLTVPTALHFYNCAWRCILKGA